MNRKLSLHNFCRSNTFIILMFAVMSILSGILMYHSHLIGTEWDLNFHWQRIYEMRDSISNGHFLPIVSLNHFNQSGSAVMSMYPSLNLLPLVLLSFLFKSYITLFNVMFILENFFRLLIAFFSSLKFNNNKKISFIFSITYVLSITSLYYYFGVSAPGTLSVISYLPLILFGFLSLLRDDKWIELTCGMTLIVFSHVLSIGIVITFLFILFIINIRLFKDFKKLKSLFKSMIVTILITSIFWIPFFIISSGNNMNIPTSQGMDGTTFSQLIFNPLDNVVTDTITLAGIVGMILSAAYYKKLSYFSKQLFWTAVVFVFVASSLFPWDIMEHTLIKHLQFPHRLYIIPQIIFCYLLAECTTIITSKVKIKNYTVITILSVCFVPLISQIGAQEKIVNSYVNRPELVSDSYDVNSIVKNNNDFKKILNSKNNYFDYYPQSAMSETNNIFNHMAKYSNRTIPVCLLGNGKFSFKAPQKISNLSLPFLYYHGINYQVKLDGKTVKGYPNKNALMTINNVHKGKHHVQIIVHKAKAEIASYILSLIGLLILIGVIVKNFLNKHKIA